MAVIYAHYTGNLQSMTSPDKAIEELTAALARVRAGDYSCSLSFDSSDPALTRLATEFNQTVRALRERQGSSDPQAVSRLIHDVKNPLAGIAGVVEILGSELPPDSIAREVLPDVKAEIEKIKQLLAEFQAK